MNIKLPNQVKKIINHLENCGYEAYIVGGCVRDSILGYKPKDWDICTSALPEQTIECFKGYRIIETGLKHGTVTVIIEDMPLEVTTYRMDGIYSDNRRPDNVRFIRNLKEDLSRRDFTINAMAYNPKAGLVDYFEGKRDIINKQIKCVGNANDRFNEDALRIMRALRFASVLDFEIECETSNAIYKNRELLNNIAVERTAVELNKLLVGTNMGRIMLNYTSVIEVFIPEINCCIGFNQNNSHHLLDVWRHILCSTEHSKKDLIIRLTMLFHDISKPLCYTEDAEHIGHFYGHAQQSSDMATNILRRLKYDNEAIETVKILVLYHDVDLQPRRKHIKRMMFKIGEDNLRMLLEVKRADIKAQNQKYKNRLEVIDEIEAIVDEIIATQQCFTLRDLAINGRDLMNIGVPQGIMVGKMLNNLMDLVLDELISNDRDVLIDKVKLLIS